MEDQNKQLTVEQSLVQRQRNLEEVTQLNEKLRSLYEAALARRHPDLLEQWQEVVTKQARVAQELLEKEDVPEKQKLIFMRGWNMQLFRDGLTISAYDGQ